MNIKVKTALPGQSWLVFDQDTKIAAVHKTNDGFVVAQKGIVSKPSSIKTVRKKLGIPSVWEPEELTSTTSRIDLDGYSTDCENYYDAMIEVKRRLPLYTKVPSSKCYFAAGWYRILYGAKTKIEFCPKLLTLNRNRYWGPFYTKDEATTLNM